MTKNVLMVCMAVLVWAGNSLAQEPAAAVVKPVGTVKSIAGNSITLTTDAGATVNVVVGDATRIARIAPGQKDLKDAAVIKLADVQAGDRIMARGKSSSDGSMMATSMIVMKAADIAAKQQQERDDWQKRSIGGLVTAVDPANQTVTISISTLGGSKSATVHVSKETAVRRYAPD